MHVINTTALFLFALTVSCSSQAASLTVRLEPPDFYKRVSGTTSWDVFLEGEIDKQAPERVSHELAKLGDSGADIYLDSPGGNLLAGIELGRVIRRFGANTNIGRRSKGEGDVQAAKCLSACSLAFLGGIYRYIKDGSVYGVHRVSSTTGPSATDLDVGQILSAAISTYIRDMGVDPALFNKMVQAGKSEIYILTPQEATALQVVNNGRKRAEWTVEAIKQGYYLRGTQETVHGIGKALFLCDKGRLMFYSIYTAGEKAKYIADGGWVHSLMVDGEVYPLPNPLDLKNDSGNINATFYLTEAQWRRVASAHSVGHAMQVARDAPTYVGYDVAIDSEASKRVQGFFEGCLNLK